MKLHVSTIYYSWYIKYTVIILLLHKVFVILILLFLLYIIIYLFIISTFIIIPTSHLIS